MTDRVHALTVVLDKDIRDDDVQVIIQAIQMIRHVADVSAHVADLETYAARARVREDLRDRMFKLWKDLSDP
jgi:hypothetical protein